DLPAHRRVRRGIALVPEGRRLFPELTVEENLRVADVRREGEWNLERVDDVYASLASLQRAGTTMLLVEQDLGRALRVATRVLCMLEGRVVLEGAAGELSREPVTDAYFGLARSTS